MSIKSCNDKNTLGEIEEKEEVGGMGEGGGSFYT